MKSFSRCFVVGALIFVTLIYAGIYFAATSRLPTGRLLLEVSAIPVSLGLACQAIHSLRNWREERGYPRSLG